MRITKIRYGRIACVVLTIVLILFMCLLTQFDIRSSRVQLAHGSFLHRNIASMGQKFNNFFQKQVFKLKYEDVHCKKKPENETLRYEKRVLALAEQINFKDSHSIFHANTGCNYWLQAFKTKFKNVKIGGASLDDDAVDYAKRYFNDTRNVFGKIVRKKNSQDFSLSDQTLQYDHAMIYGGLQENMELPAQCSLVKQLLQMVKAGGSVYIGRNMEKDTCDFVHKYANYIVAPPCYWEDVCLKQRAGVAEIYYIRERDLFNDPSIDECLTAVFIHKKIVVSANKGGVREEHLEKRRYKPHPKMFHCDNTSTLPALPINQTIATALSVFPVRSLSKSFEKFKEARKNAKAQANSTKA